MISIPQLVLLVATGSALGGAIAFFIFVTVMKVTAQERVQRGQDCPICSLVYHRTVYLKQPTHIGCESDQRDL